MAHGFASEQWIDDFWGQLRTDERFRRAAASWVYGPALLVIEADADKQFPDTVQIVLDVHEGGARKVALAPDQRADLVPFAVAGGYDRWKAVVQGTLEPLEAIYQGRLRFHGDLPTLARYPEMVAALIAAAGRVDTDFQDEQPAPEPARAGAGSSK